MEYTGPSNCVAGRRTAGGNMEFPHNIVVVRRTVRGNMKYSGPLNCVAGRHAAFAYKHTTTTGDRSAVYHAAGRNAQAAPG